MRNFFLNQCTVLFYSILFCLVARVIKESVTLSRGREHCEGYVCRSADGGWKAEGREEICNSVCVAVKFVYAGHLAMTLIVRIYKEYHSVCPSSEFILPSPNPSLASESAPPLKTGWGGKLACG
jgi:hypothetical protein